jgi:hypothetical protein
MGREIRRVPLDWTHPRDARGRYQPMDDEAYEDAAARWLADCLAWSQGTTGTEEQRKSHPYFWDWHGPPPNRAYYRPKWREETRVGYQVYETVTEGTPVSPVFKSKDELIAWLTAPIPADDQYPDLSVQGMSSAQAERFVEAAWAPSFIMRAGQPLVTGPKAL